MTTLARELRRLAWACCLALLMSQNGAADSVGHELLQTKRGTAEYTAAIAKLRLRDPGQDARRDLASGDHTLYCVGTIACMTPGLSGELPEGVAISATAATGCVILGGDLEMTYRAHEERYVEVYNRAKLAALQSIARGQ